MTFVRSGSLPLLLIAGLVAVGAGVFAALREPGPPGAQAGHLAPEFSLPGLEEGHLSLSDYRGRVLFVNFWATWCAPCKEEAPALERLYRRLGDRDFALLAISVDAPERRAAVRDFREEFELSFPILLDPRREAYRRYRVYGVPETFLIDARGRIAERFIGPRNWDDPRYAHAIERLLPAPSRSGGARG